MASPTAARTVSISTMLNAPDSERIDTAITQNDSSVAGHPKDDVNELRRPGHRY